MTNDEIAALPVSKQADADAHLYLWVTNPRLFRGRFDPIGPIDIVEAWGFEYVTLLTWHKLGAPGMGFYFRGDTEHVIFAKRGNAPIDAAIRQSNHFAASARALCQAGSVLRDRGAREFWAIPRTVRTA